MITNNLQDVLASVASQLPSTAVSQAQAAVATAQLMRNSKLSAAGFDTVKDACDFVNSLDPDEAIYSSIIADNSPDANYAVLYWRKL